jgi:Uma2 family endonuclease
MNAPVHHDSLTRHRFTIDEVLRLIADGLIDKRVQLLDGDIFHMPSDGDRHISITMALARLAIETLKSPDYFVGVQTTLRLSAHNAPSPDLYVLAGGAPQGVVADDRILLVIEVADTSSKDDLTDSASRYARHGVAEFWVIDVNARRIHVHRRPEDGAYLSIQVVDAHEQATAQALPGLGVSLDHLAPA